MQKEYRLTEKRLFALAFDIFGAFWCRWIGRMDSSRRKREIETGAGPPQQVKGLKQTDSTSSLLLYVRNVTVYDANCSKCLSRLSKKEQFFWPSGFTTEVLSYRGEKVVIIFARFLWRLPCR